MPVGTGAMENFYSIADNQSGSTETAPWVAQMSPLIATIGTGNGREFSVEVIINYEVIADYRVSDLFPSKMKNSFFGESSKSLRKIGSLFS